MKNITPYEAWFHRKTMVNHLKFFRCIPYVLINENNSGKMDKKSEKGVFIGYSNESKGDWLYNPQTKKLIIIRDVFFDESSYINWDESSINEKS